MPIFGDESARLVAVRRMCRGGGLAALPEMLDLSPQRTSSRISSVLQQVCGISSLNLRGPALNR